MPHRDLVTANTARKDEFYTQLADIEKELRHYKEFFNGKCVLCNCDDPRVSNFFRYFSLNFEYLKLKKLICTCYKNQDVDLFSQGTKEQAVYTVYEGDKNENREVDKEEIQVIPLHGDGDFRSPECIELLKEADIVVTNPPFSLFREYIAQLYKYKKQFIIIGNTNALTYKEVFTLFKNDEIRTGYTNFNVGMFFQVPDSYEKYHHKDAQGNKIARVSTSCWFTNLPVQRHKEGIILYKTYNPAAYPKYDNYDAIEVSTYKDIPCDWNGVMGVPITFIDKYNPEQFEIVKFRKGNDEKDLAINGKTPYFRILIKRR